MSKNQGDSLQFKGLILNFFVVYHQPIVSDLLKLLIVVF